jgi:gamma-glutamyltranspeptidase/glutathione hydrolase
MAISVAGGDLQDQTTLNCFLNHVEFGMMPEDAVAAVRFSTGHHEDSFKPNPDREETLDELQSLTVNHQLDDRVIGALVKRGHKVETTSRAIARPVMIYVDPDTGIIYAAGDPKAQRHAAAF